MATADMWTGDPERSFIEVDDLEICYNGVAAVKGVSFAVGRGEHLTLLGPSGCGKSTTLRAIAGLEAATNGEIRIDGRVVYSKEKRLNLPPEKRELSMMFQSYAIWPHMTVYDNVAFGLTIRKKPKDEVRREVEAMLDLVRLGDFADRPSSHLSGGQQQRVALARSLAFGPKALLLDEPLSNLDAKLRAEMRIELRELQTRVGITSISVTHDLEEALAGSDRIIVMRDGKIEQVGTPVEIYDRPQTSFVAGFVGATNLFSGKVIGVDGASGNIRFEMNGGAILECACPDYNPASSAVSIRTVYPKLSRSPEEAIGNRPNAFKGKVVKRVFLGDAVQYHIDLSGHDFIVKKPPLELLTEGEAVVVQIDPRHCVLVI